MINKAHQVLSGTTDHSPSRINTMPYYSDITERLGSVLGIDMLVKARWEIEGDIPTILWASVQFCNKPTRLFRFCLLTNRRTWVQVRKWVRELWEEMHTYLIYLDMGPNRAKFVQMLWQYHMIIQQQQITDSQDNWIYQIPLLKRNAWSKQQHDWLEVKWLVLVRFHHPTNPRSQEWCTT